MGKLLNIDYWKKEFGLLPMHLNPILNEEKYLMLNGGNGDFCLQTSQEKEDLEKYFEDSWSTNTKNYIVINDDNVIINNWFEKKSEIIPKKRIEPNIEKFYKYITSKSFKTQDDIIPFILNIFKKLRNVTFEKENPVEAINTLFLLLISIEERKTNIDFKKWGVHDSKLPSNFEYFSEIINNGINSISPNLDLLLRHTSGTLFQEAHREVIYFNPQRDLFGGVSSELITKKQAYSSIHYTPQYLARSIVENSIGNLDLNKKNLKILDPSCGSSEFLIEVLKQLKNLNYKGKIIVKGWDSSQTAINTSNFLLKYENRTQWNNKLEIQIKLIEDSLLEEWGTDNDLIVMNPPFVSWELLKNKINKEAIRDTLKEVFNGGRPNQASAFFYKASESLSEGGVLGCVLPSSIFSYNSYNKLRNVIEEKLSINIIAKLGNFVFEDALTDVSFFIGKKPKSPNSVKVVWTKNEKGNVQEALRNLRKINSTSQQAVQQKNFSIYTPSYFPVVKNSWRIISLEENDFIRDIERFAIAGNLTTIGEIFNIKQGALLGVKNIFKISIDEYEALKKDEKKHFRPVITNSSIKTGKLIIFEYVWYPYDKNGLTINSEEELASISFAENVLKKNRALLEKRNGISKWWSLTRPRTWQYVQKKRLYSTRFGNSNSFAFDINGDCIIEEGNAFLPKKELSNNDYYFYLSCFTSKTFDLLLSIYSKPIMSGFDLGRIQIKDIPVPNIKLKNTKESEAYLKLVELGKELTEGNTFVKEVIDDVLVNYFYPRK
ncbi:N-6 DNA Methylase [Salegentibacter holothuriorum]|uniref:site-specific DNA-methyltransferase (adenine-specific) n=1 Tax=Salegentibacter holothuriorum TaxID=241145 RepID=A0A1T5CHG4_9FLAO|nr:N-6 DNA methylase [Salegentibacter holothuriorum]SKB58935.1 N-6 DNA Methylase [Salegentibacter holothuriorum]